jgi:hypothetical protein
MSDIEKLIERLDQRDKDTDPERTWSVPTIFAEAAAALRSLVAENERLKVVGEYKLDPIGDFELDQAQARAEKAEAEAERLHQTCVAESKRIADFISEVTELRAERVERERLDLLNEED